jgi:hypothetical protein
VATDPALPGILASASAELGSAMNLLSEANNAILTARPRVDVWRGRAADKATDSIKNVNDKLLAAYQSFQEAQNALDTAQALAERAIAYEKAAEAARRAAEQQARRTQQHG